MDDASDLATKLEGEVAALDPNRDAATVHDFESRKHQRVL
jgi:hypothetical protein